ncbi:MAG TPA: alpha/beta hydrolase-fold protein [Polyangiaceae bacterium]|nr:alpha/beta hydrolase-fold protein [Polyangiaceae bacterium]
MRHWLLPTALCACVSNLLAAAAVVAAPSLSPKSAASGGWVLPLPTRSAARQERSEPPESAPPEPAPVPASGASEVPAAAVGSDANAAPLTPDAVAQLAQQILARDDLAAYHGWIRYLQFRAAHASERFSDQPGAVVEDRLRLAQWTRKILDDPGALSELRGVTEWAYSSPVDGSGQPFKLNIPTDYDPAHPAPLSLQLHGRSGNHLEDSTDMREHAGYFELSVLGRARGGNYRALSEADVLQALDYVSQHWAIDRSRVHLVGGGMGGSGALWLASRYPQLFASGRSVCGSASDKPVGNLLTFPIYALHSEDDDRVPVLSARGPFSKLLALGGKVTLEEPTGYGHAVWNYHEGTARADAWFPQQVRPESRTVKKLDFTALDGEAVRAFWAEIAEWGPEPKPARFALEVAAKNRLEARLDNIRSLRLRIAESPLERDQPLHLRIEGAPALSLPAPLPEEVWLERAEGAWLFADAAPTSPFRLHTPGGANQLYDGEPLLIVYGTHADGATRAALRAAASAASRSSNASWSKPGRDGGDDGVAYNQNLYGDLNMKADSEVTPDDIAHRHLVLIGTAAQNSVVAAIAARLPVRLENGSIAWSDGSQLSSHDRALGLVHYNPDAPDRLIFWVASDDAAAYSAGSLAPELLGAFPSGADAVVVRVSEPTLVASRSFDSRWHWLSREQSALLPATLASNADLARAVAAAVRRAAPADFAIAGLPEPARTSAYEPGEARLVDLVAQNYFAPVSVMTVRGSDLLQAARAIAASEASIEPAAELGRVQPQREYRLALSARQLSPFVQLTRLRPRKYELLDTSVAQALGRFGIAGAPSVATAPTTAAPASSTLATR